MLYILKYLVNWPINVIMNLEDVCLYYGIQCGSIRRIHGDGFVENSYRTCHGSIKNTVARGFMNTLQKPFEESTK